MAVVQRALFQFICPAYQKGPSDHNIASGWRRTVLASANPQQVPRVLQHASEDNVEPK